MPIPPVNIDRAYLAATYALLLSVAIAVRTYRSGASLPPIGTGIVVTFMTLAAVHRFCTGYRIETSGCTIGASMFNRLSPRKRGVRFASTVLFALGLSVVATAATPLELNARNKTQAYLATMRADPRNLVAAQESFFADSSRFVDRVEERTADGYVLSTGGEFVSLSAHTDGFSARVRYASGTERECWIDFGPLADGSANAYDGEPQCDPAPID